MTVVIAYLLPQEVSGRPLWMCMHCEAGRALGTRWIAGAERAGGAREGAWGARRAREEGGREGGAHGTHRTPNAVS